ncbi:MAG TPA: MarR family transcriptional regulator [Pseudonocardiaceae bacterium]|jgi:hypothetical protein
MDQPIGFWLKHLDGLIERTFEHVLGRRGLRRRHWQLLNIVHEGGGADRAAAAGALRPFWTADGPSQPEVEDDLAGRGWLVVDGEAYRLTDKGRRAHAEVLAEVADIRRRSLDGLTGDEYQAVVGTLRRMSANLERAIA